MMGITTSIKTAQSSAAGVYLFSVIALAAWTGCSSQDYRTSVDETAYEIVEEKQQEALGESEPFTVDAPAESLRRQLMLSQELPYARPASLGVQNLEPLEHWPNDDYLQKQDAPGKERAAVTNGTVQLTLIEALQVAAQNNRDYQSRKESVFRTAMDLDLERDQFRTTFAGLLDGSYNQDRSGLTQEDGEVNESLSGSATLSATQRLKSGGQLSLQLGWDVIKLLQPDQFVSDSVIGDASISIPLLRGAGRHIVTEPLKQAERDVIYALYDFENFKRSFAVQVADSYLSVLQRRNEVENAEENYRGLVTSTRRARKYLEANRLPPIQVDQAIQDELSARNRWVSAREAYASALDSFNLLLGLPADAEVQLDPTEFDKLGETVSSVIEGATAIDQEEDVPPADAPVELEEPTDEDAGPMELEPNYAIELALTNRLDLHIALGRVYDAQRRIVVAADQLKPEVTLFGSAALSADDFSDLDLDTGNYEALLNIDLPLERTSEAISYRNSFINLESQIRNLQELEDSIKLDVMERLRVLREARESLRIQAISVDLAQHRVRGANLNLKAGRIEIRDLLEAQEDLLSSQNSLTSAKVNYRVAELALQRDLGVLEVNSEGLWQEFNPGTMNPETGNNGSKL